MRQPRKGIEAEQFQFRHRLLHLNPSVVRKQNLFAPTAHSEEFV